MEVCGEESEGMKKEEKGKQEMKKTDKYLVE